MLHGIQKCFIIIQTRNRCVQPKEDLSRLVSEKTKQQPATLKDLLTQELVIYAKSRLFELSRFQALGNLEHEITKKFCRFQIREEVARLNAATHNAIANAHARFVDESQGGDEN